MNPQSSIFLGRLLLQSIAKCPVSRPILALKFVSVFKAGGVRRVSNTSRKFSEAPAGKPNNNNNSDSVTPSSSSSNLIVEVKDGIRTITLNRPGKKNAMLQEMANKITTLLQEANADEGTKIVVLTGTGDYFCSGNDLGNLVNMADGTFKSTAELHTCRDYLRSHVASFIDCQKPIVALVNGSALGMGVTLFGLVDIVYAVEGATFKTPFTALGQTPELCSSYTFPKIMGNSRANELLLFNATITATQAKSYGLVTEVFPASSFQAETQKRVQTLAQLPIKALVSSKELVRERERKLLHQVNEEECEVLCERWQSQDCQEQIGKFFSKK